MALRKGMLAAAAVLFVWALGGHDVWAPDEPYFAEGAREMIVDGHWAVPHVNGVVSTDKPPLFFWLIALFSLPLGEVTPLTARLPSALAALGTLALTMRLGRRFYGPATSALAGGVLATTFMFWDKARWSQTDSLLCFFIWVALAAFAAFRAGEADGRRAGLLFWLAAALAVLTKGPVGVLLPLGIALVTLATDSTAAGGQPLDGEPGRRRGFGSWSRFAPVSGPLVFVLVLALWAAWAMLGSGSDYSVWGALREHFVDRVIHGMHHRQPFWYFSERLPPSLLPWTFVVPGALVLAWRRRGRPGDRFLLAVVVFVVAFFSISTEKRELYALPSLPAFALLVAALVAAVAGWREPAGEEPPAVSRRWVTVGQGVLGAAFTLLALALPALVPQRLEEVPRSALLLPSAVLLVAGVATLFFAWRGRVVAAVAAPGAGIAVFYLVAVSTLVPLLEPAKSARPFSLRIQEVTAESVAAGLPVVAYHLDNLPEHFAFHTNGLYTRETVDWQAVVDHLERPEPVFAVLNGDTAGAWPPGLPQRLYLVDSTRLARREVLLVANFAYPGAALLATAAEASRAGRPRAPAGASPAGACATSGPAASSTGTRPRGAAGAPGRRSCRSGRAA